MGLVFGGCPHITPRRVAPFGEVRALQRLKHTTMVGISQMQQLMDDDLVLEALLLIEKVCSQGDGSRR